jgi:hypothetical protein
MCTMSETSTGGDRRPAAGLHRHQALERQTLDRVAKGRAADAELGHQLVLAQERDGRQLEGDDQVA